MGWTWAAAALALAILPAAAASSTPMSATVGWDGPPAAAIYDGSAAWVFWAHAGAASTGVDRYDPATDTRTTIPLTLPGTVLDAVWTGSAALVLTAQDGVARFHRVDLAARAYTTLAAAPAAGDNAFWDGRHAYVLALGEPPYNVLRFDPAANAWATLPYGLGAGSEDAVRGGAVVWTGTVAYVVGRGPGEPSSGKAFRVDPAAGEVALVTDQLPVHRETAAAAWLQGAVRVFSEDQTFVLDAATGAVTLDPEPLPMRFREAVAVAVGPCDAYLFGGIAGGAHDPAPDFGYGIVRHSACATPPAPPPANATAPPPPVPVTTTRAPDPPVPDAAGGTTAPVPTATVAARARGPAQAQDAAAPAVALAFAALAAALWTRRA